MVDGWVTGFNDGKVLIPLVVPPRFVAKGAPIGLNCATFNGLNGVTPGAAVVRGLNSPIG